MLKILLDRFWFNWPEPINIDLGLEECDIHRGGSLGGQDKLQAFGMGQG